MHSPTTPAVHLLELPSISGSRTVRVVVLPLILTLFLGVKGWAAQSTTKGCA